MATSASPRLSKPSFQRQVDPNTGEVRDTMVQTEVVPRKRAAGLHKESNWTMAWGEHLAKLPLGRDWQVFWALTGLIDIERGYASYRSSEIAEDLGVSTQAVSRAITNLVAAGVVIRISPRRLRFHPKLVWRGALANRRELMYELDGQTSAS